MKHYKVYKSSREEELTPEEENFIQHVILPTCGVRVLGEGIGHEIVIEKAGVYGLSISLKRAEELLAIAKRRVEGKGPGRRRHNYFASSKSLY